MSQESRQEWQEADNNIRLLIVEDHEATLAGLVASLSKEPGIEIIGSASNATNGLSLARKERPDIILLDLHLPDGDGPKSTVSKFCQQLDSSRIIVFSAESRRAFVQAILDLGVSGYLLKSESIANVVEAIRKVASGQKLVKSSSIAEGKEKLTKAEQEILTHLARGMKYQEIADERKASPATVRKQCELLLLKLGLENREQLIAWAVENGYGKLSQ